ncbi:hypothetical protein D5W64_13095 [Salmonella enterica subsp. enterica serovar Saintpaul]|nr:hypothetical protein [Salmonella enterica subsp. enterica serovar Saintpaul]
MSQAKSAQNKHAKRNARAKQKRQQVARGKAAPEAIKKRRIRAMLNANGTIPDFDAALENAVMDIKKGKSVESEFKDTTDMLEGLKRAVGEVFKLYCYVTLANYLIEAGAIQHELTIDLEEASRVLMNFDTRIGTIQFLNNEPDPETELAIQTEALDIGTNLGQISEMLYQEVTRLEVHGPIMEDTIARLTKEIPEDVTDPAARYSKALEAVAHDYLYKLMIRDKEAEAAAKVEQPKEVDPSVHDEGAKLSA